jgi:predicted membrane protein
MRFGGVIFGLIIVLIGAALLFDNLDAGSNNIPGDYWPVILIAMGFIGWVRKGLRPELGSMVLMSLGGILLTQNLVDDKSFGDLWPVLAIAVGVSILFGSGNRKRKKHGFGMKFQGGGKRWKNKHGHRSSSEASAFFSGGSRSFEGEYTGSTEKVRLGSGGIDFSTATLPEEGATLRLDIALGEYKIQVPSHWKVDIQTEITMAEIEDDRAPAEEERTGPTLTVGGKVLMGSVHISG